MDWWLAPIDPDRAHAVGFAVSWHARSMVLAWGILAPLAVFIARYFKVLPRQDWPRELDNQLWWRSHWIGHSCVAGLSLLGLGLIIDGVGMPKLHGSLGYCVLGLMALQIAFGILRGTKGGPTTGCLRGDHYDMTPRRVAFEYAHKTLGYLTLVLAIATILAGLWEANGPRWMWACLLVWWTGLLACSVYLQRRGHAIDTYQAIWGPDPKHPGNRRRPVGWGIRRMEGEAHVRSD